jgi:polysaccharide pyruvyl transferase WcaK-like protein
VWQDNDASMGALLEGFDLVAVRESRSLREVRKWRADAILAPDVLFAAWDAGDPTAVTPGEDVAVIDGVGDGAARSLHDFAEFHRWPFYLMGRLHVPALMERPGAGYEVRGNAFPRILRSARDIAGLRGCVSGRFHGLVAALVMGVPVAALASNTHKIEGLLEDLELADLAQLDPQWLSWGQLRRRDDLERRIALWSKARCAHVRTRVQAAAESVEALFEDVRGLTRLS